jgi:hypothetical protein
MEVLHKLIFFPLESTTSPGVFALRNTIFWVTKVLALDNENKHLTLLHEEAVDDGHTLGQHTDLQVVLQHAIHHVRMSKLKFNSLTLFRIQNASEKLSLKKKHLISCIRPDINDGSENSRPAKLMG